MKNTIKLSLAATAAFLASATLAQAANSVTTTATATVLSPIAITQSRALTFGSFTSGSTAGTINNATNAKTGGVTNIDANAGAPAIYTVTGSANATFAITAPSTVTLASTGKPSMVATLSTPPGGVLNASGTLDFNISGVLAVAANQPAGAYSGTYNVTVAY